MGWLSDVDFRDWEAKNIKVTKIVNIGQVFFESDVFQAWKKKQISHLECYGESGSGKVCQSCLRVFSVN
jgi:hypothetical protein